MGDVKHTPGPWFVSVDNEAVGTNASDIRGNIVCEAPKDFEHSMAFWPANARLIAAAPDLVEALKAISDMFMSRPDMLRAITPLCGTAEHAVFGQARAALSKAGV
jgi:hypothetical protein